MSDADEKALDERAKAAADDSLRTENAALHDEIKTLQDELLRAHERFRVFASTLPGVLWEVWGRPDETGTSFVTDSVQAITGYSAEEWQNNAGVWLEHIDPGDRGRVRATIERCYANKEAGGMVQYRFVTKDGRLIWLHLRFSIIRDEYGEPLIFQAFAIDISDQKRAELERDRIREELIENQAAMLAEMSTPLIPISKDMVAMPLVGRVDRARAARVLDVLLHGISRARARFAILDITGVPELDAPVAQMLIQASRTARMLGAQVFISGIRPEAAAALTSLSEDLRDIPVCATLEHGIAMVLRRSSTAR